MVLHGKECLCIVVQAGFLLSLYLDDAFIEVLMGNL